MHQVFGKLFFRCRRAIQPFIALLVHDFLLCTLPYRLAASLWLQLFDLSYRRHVPEASDFLLMAEISVHFRLQLCRGGLICCLIPLRFTYIMESLSI